MASGSVGVRLAQPEDVPKIIEMIKALAVFEKISGEPELTDEGISNIV